MSYVSEAIPLRAALRVHVVDIVVGEVLSQSFDLLLKDFAAESRLVGYIKRKAIRVSK